MFARFGYLAGQSIDLQPQNSEHPYDVTSTLAVGQELGLIFSQNQTWWHGAQDFEKYMEEHASKYKHYLEAQ